jgi:murein DD-endopeptidase MepM/ murein hydrolase activator NlpD
MHGWDWTRWVLDAAPAVFFLSLVLPLGLRAMRLGWARDGFLLIVLMIALDALGHREAEAAVGLALIAGSARFAVLADRRSRRMKAAWLERWSAAGALVVSAPFRGRWRASGCGPNPAKNHHLAAPDQWFAADFARVDGESFGSEILSPVDGVVARVEDGHPDIRAARFFRRPNARSPAGNYVSIEVAGTEGPLAYVLLCHLKQGSVGVAAGAGVRVGEAVGLCGNSGNTTAPHLHIHAQDRAEIAVGRAVGLPLRFREQAAAERLEPGAILESGGSASAA